MQSSVTLLFGGLVLVAVFHTTWAVSCHVCTQNCDEPFVDGYTETSSRYRADNCTHCTKLRTLLVAYELVITRDCAYNLTASASNECVENYYNVLVRGGMKNRVGTTKCECDDGDFCNGAPYVSTNGMLALVLTAVTAMFV